MMHPLRRLARRWIRAEGQRIPVLVLEVQTCADRCTKGFEHMLPELEAAGRCNSAHGGSCCVCGGSLPDGHLHLWGPNSFNPEWQGCCGDDVGFGGNVCSAACRWTFVEWLEDRPPKFAICPGHGEVWAGTARHQRHSVTVEYIDA